VALATKRPGVSRVSPLPGPFAGLAVVFSVSLLARGATASPATTSIAQGWDLGVVETPRSLAMGGALTALGASTVALQLNPASLELSRVYHFEALGSYSPEARRYDGGGAIVDSANGRFGGGLGVDFGMLDPDGIHRSWTDVRVALAYQLGDYIAIGLTGRYLSVSQHPSVGPFGFSLISDGTPGSSIDEIFTFDAGLTVTPTQGLHIAFAGHNLSDPGVALAPTTVVGGIGYGTHVFAVEADVLTDFTTWQKDTVRAMLGTELFVADHIPLRLGYRYDEGNQTHALSGGVGYIGQQWSIEYSVRHDIVSDHPSTMMSLSLRYFYDSTGTLGVQDPGGI